MKTGRGILGIFVLAIASASVWLATHLVQPNTPSAASISQDVYVWQRDWTPAVRNAIRDQQPRVGQLVILAAEISLRPLPGKVTIVHPEYSACIGKPIGLAIRVGPVSGSSAYDPQSAQTKLLCSTAVDAISDAHAAGISVVELQIDFDCAESKLSGYRNWLSAVKSAVAPVPVVITALPSWLGHLSFTELARDAGAFVIQVHSLHQPTSPNDGMMICDPAEAERAVSDAAKLGVPFRVALPTYTYLAGFTGEGKFLGLGAEGPLPSWPVGTLLRSMRSDPAQIAPLVSKWIAQPPANMTGIIWYRLPVAGDAMNWSAITLQAVMTGRIPQAKLIAEVEHSKPALVDLFVKNTGDADSVARLELSIDGDNPLLVSEGINGFDRLESQAGGVIFRDGSNDGRRIAPGERIQVGWLRIAEDKEVQAHVTAASSSSK